MVDLRNKEASEILNNKELLDAFKRQYEMYFGYIPDCVPCKIKNNLAQLKRILNSKNKKIMSKKIMSKKKGAYKLKRSYLRTIFSFKDKRTVHFFGRNLTDELAKKFIEKGINPKTKAEREAMFEVLPVKEKPAKPVKETKEQK